MSHYAKAGVLLCYVFEDSYTCCVRWDELLGTAIPPLLDYLKARHGKVIEIREPNGPSPRQLPFSLSFAPHSSKTKETFSDQQIKAAAEVAAILSGLEMWASLRFKASA